MKKRDRAPLVLIEWVDAASVTDRWEDRAQAIKEGIYYSTNPILACGFLIAERKDVIVLALTYNHHNDDVSKVMSVPRMAVRRIIPLRGPKGVLMPGDVPKVETVAASNGRS